MPNSFESKSSGYSIDLKKLYDKGKLTNADLPRIVDDGYPSVIIGRTTLTKGINGDFNEYLTLKDGDPISKDDIKEVLTYEKTLEFDPELFKELSDEDRAKMEAEIAKYQKDATLFWKTAETKKGKVLDFQTRGRTKNEETTLVNYMNTVNGYKGYRFNNYWKYLEEKKGFYWVTYDSEKDPELWENQAKHLINYESACRL